jgi:NAD(P)-dependent dehydrogenase (short-subunit alcohol dehydrogenase family)
MNNQQVVITGASRGIGLGLVQQYLDNDSQVYAVCREVNEALGKLASQYPCLTLLIADLADEQAIQQLAKELAERQVQIDILINNAGVHIEQALGEWTQAAFMHNYLINAVTPALVIQSLSDCLSPIAKVIQLSSGVASFALSEGSAVLPYDSYAMSKVALNMLVRRLAVKTRDSSQIYCAISPGWVRTEMGGEQAPLSIEQAGDYLVHTIDDLCKKDSGAFIDE